ncbi:MAG: hypothetical protein RI985_588 [Chloroflexota bacterium]|jgi:hypothetical protein
MEIAIVVVGIIAVALWSLLRQPQAVTRPVEIRRQSRRRR